MGGATRTVSFSSARPAATRCVYTGAGVWKRKYLTAIAAVLDTDKKTILHIPHVRAGESTKDKHGEVDTILDLIGTVEFTDPETGVLHVKRKTDGKIIKVWDTLSTRPR